MKDYKIIISKETSNEDWRFYKTILDQLKKDRLITNDEWYFAIVYIRKKLLLITIN